MGGETKTMSNAMTITNAKVHAKVNAKVNAKTKTPHPSLLAFSMSRMASGS